MRSFLPSVDTPIFLAFVYIFLTRNVFGFGYYHEKWFYAFCSLLGLLYLLLEVLQVSYSKFVLPIKIVLILLFITVAIFGNTINLINLRKNDLRYYYINDSALQSELSGIYVISGRNPYLHDFEHTDLDKWPYKDEDGNTKNPAVFHNVIPPFLITASAFGFRVFSRIFGFFDVRIVLLLSYFSVIALAFLRFANLQRLLFLILVCLNPLFVKNMVEGTNDIVVVSFLLWSLYFLEKKKLFYSGLLVGLSVATKQTAWFAIPFFLFYVLSTFKNKKLQFIAPFFIIVLLFYVPYLIENPSVVLSNLVMYATSHPYQDVTTRPIEGLGFSMFLLSQGFVKTIYTSFPFWILQLGTGIPLIAYLLYLQKKLQTPQFVLFSTVVVTGVVWFFSRYFLESHLAYLLVMTSAMYLWEKSKTLV